MDVSTQMESVQVALPLSLWAVKTRPVTSKDVYSMMLRDALNASTLTLFSVMESADCHYVPTLLTINAKIVSRDTSSETNNVLLLMSTVLNLLQIILVNNANQDFTWNWTDIARRNLQEPTTLMLPSFHADSLSLSILRLNFVSLTDALNTLTEVAKPVQFPMSLTTITVSFQTAQELKLEFVFNVMRNLFQWMEFVRLETLTARFTNRTEFANRASKIFFSQALTLALEKLQVASTLAKNVLLAMFLLFSEMEHVISRVVNKQMIKDVLNVNTPTNLIVMEFVPSPIVSRQRMSSV